MNYRELAFERFKEGEEPYCEECGMLESEARETYRYGLVAHHLDMLHKAHEDYHKNNDPDNLKVLCSSCHRKVHNIGDSNPMYGKSHTEETKRKISDSLKGVNSPMYGNSKSEETKRKISDSLKGVNSYWFGRLHTEESKQKMTESMVGKKKIVLYTNYEINVRCLSEEKPEGFKKVQRLVSVSLEEKQRIKNLPTYSMVDYKNPYYEIEEVINEDKVNK